MWPWGACWLRKPGGQGRRCDGKSVCGLGVAFACAVGHSETLLQSFKGFRGLGAGKRQAWTPRRSH